MEPGGRVDGAGGEAEAAVGNMLDMQGKKRGPVGTAATAVGGGIPECSPRAGAGMTQLGGARVSCECGTSCRGTAGATRRTAGAEGVGGGGGGCEDP